MSMVQRLEKPWSGVTPACLHCRVGTDRGVPACQRSVLRLVSRCPPSRQKAFVTLLASGLSSNKKVDFFPLHMPSKKAPLSWIGLSFLGSHGRSVLFSVLYRLALVCLPHVCVSLYYAFITDTPNHSK